MGIEYPGGIMLNVCLELLFLEKWFSNYFPKIDYFTGNEEGHVEMGLLQLYHSDTMVFSWQILLPSVFFFIIWIKRMSFSFGRGGVLKCASFDVSVLSDSCYLFFNCWMIYMVTSISLLFIDGIYPSQHSIIEHM